MSETKRSTIGVLKEYFGLKEGQKLKDFAAEIRQLSEDEKEALAAGILDESFDYQ